LNSVLRFGTGEVVTVLRSGADTGGELFEFETLLPPGRGGPPAHLHLYERESFTVLAGRLSVRLGRDRFELGPGEHAEVPPKTVHSFDNPTDRPVRFLTRSTPAGVLEDLLRAADGHRWWPLLDLAEINHGSRASLFIAGVPLWPQHAVLNGLAGLSRLRRRIRRP
jgi:mannose-6-phosphate isomerase-like protein (cupin superfamily)